MAVTKSMAKGMIKDGKSPPELTSLTSFEAFTPGIRPTMAAKTAEVTVDLGKLARLKLAAILPLASHGVLALVSLGTTFIDTGAVIAG
jgi:hypothetical protein